MLFSTRRTAPSQPPHIIATFNVTVCSATLVTNQSLTYKLAFDARHDFIV